MHTVVPLFDRGLMLVTDESTENNAKDWPKIVWILDARNEENLVPISTCPLPGHKAYAARGWFGAHNSPENVPLPTCWQSDQVVLGTFFNGGLRAYDISNPYQPQAIATFVPPAVPGAPTGTTQINDVFIGERGGVDWGPHPPPRPAGGDRALRAAAGSRRADRHHPDQRRVHRRARGGVLRRPSPRRA